MSWKPRKLLDAALLRWSVYAEYAPADLLHSTIVIGHTGAGKSSGPLSDLARSVLFPASEPGKGDACLDDAATR